jgi:inner membrane protein involved in colicin E2 resistance
MTEISCFFLSLQAFSVVRVRVFDYLKVEQYYLVGVCNFLFFLLLLLLFGQQCFICPFLPNRIVFRKIIDNIQKNKRDKTNSKGFQCHML